MSMPNGGWRPWLMSELNNLDIYACALPMPIPEEPSCEEWIKQINQVITDVNEDIFLVGHSLGSAAILNYLETLNNPKRFGGVFLVSGPVEKLAVDNPNSKIRKADSFFTHDFDYKKIKDTSNNFVIIHGDNDERVPFYHAEKSSKELNGQLVVVKDGGHLNGKAGFNTLPILLEKFIEINQ